MLSEVTVDKADDGSSDGREVDVVGVVYVGEVGDVGDVEEVLGVVEVVGVVDVVEAQARENQSRTADMALASSGSGELPLDVD
jgi:hypothetical protein